MAEESPVILAVRKKVRKWIEADETFEILDLSYMGITELPADVFAGCSQLQKVNLFGNQLTSLPDTLFAECSQLQNVWLCNNQLTSLPDTLFAGCSQLWCINLHGNRLTSLPDTLFAGCSRLRHVLLYNNQLASFPDTLFAGCSQLWCMNLQNNQLKYLPESILAQFSKLEYCWLDDHLYSQALWHIDNLDNLQILNYKGVNEKYPAECKYIIACRRDPLDASTYAWSVRRFAIVAGCF